MIAHCQLLVIGLFLFKNKDKCLRYVFWYYADLTLYQ